MVVCDVDARRSQATLRQQVLALDDDGVPVEMRALIARVDDQGRSSVVEQAEVVVQAGEGSAIRTAVVCATETCPPAVGPPGPAVRAELGLLAGMVRWMALEFPPGAGAPLHHTDTIDLAFVFEGGIELKLDDGVHCLGPGDFVVLNGVDHGWRAGPEGCRMSSVVVGATRP